MAITVITLSVQVMGPEYANAALSRVMCLLVSEQNSKLVQMVTGLIRTKTVEICRRLSHGRQVDY